MNVEAANSAGVAAAEAVKAGPQSLGLQPEVGYLELFHFNGVNFGLSLLIFFTLLYVLGKFVWKPILKVLDDRDERIRRDIDAAEKKRLEADLALEERKKLERQLRDDSAAILQNAKREAEKESQEIVARAKADAQRIVDQTRLDIVRERNDAIKEIRRVAVGVGIGLANKLIRKEVDASVHKAVIDESMAEIDKAWSTGR